MKDVRVRDGDRRLAAIRRSVIDSTGGIVGARAVGWLQLSPRTAVTMLAVSTASSPSPCLNSTSQCWLDRLARARRVRTAYSPRAIGAQKLTVMAIGSPARSGRSSTTRKAVAAEAPPNGPMNVQ